MLEIELLTTVLAAIGGLANIWHNIEGIIYGSFTAPDIGEAVVDFAGCEAHVNNWGGSKMLRRYDRNWSMVRYEPEVRSLY